MLKILALFLAALLLSCSFIHGQIDLPPSHVTHPNEKVWVRELPLRVARSAGTMAIVAAALEIIFNDPSICCGKGSTLEIRRSR